MIRRAIAAIGRAWRAYCELVANRGCAHNSERACYWCGGRAPGDW